MAKTAYQTVDEYIAAQPEAVRPVLERVRAIIRKALPRATEGISYQMPIYKMDGVMVLYFAGYEHHYSIYPASERVVDELADELTGRLHSKATIRFPIDARIPTGLLTRIAKLRAAEVREKSAARTAQTRRATKR